MSFSKLQIQPTADTTGPWLHAVSCSVIVSSPSPKQPRISLRHLREGFVFNCTEGGAFLSCVGSLCFRHRGDLLIEVLHVLNRRELWVLAKITRYDYTLLGTWQGQKISRKRADWSPRFLPGLSARAMASPSCTDVLAWKGPRLFCVSACADRGVWEMLDTVMIRVCKM